MKAGRQLRSEAMGYAPVGKLLLRFSGPAIISTLIMASYNVVDAIFVGRLGTEALAALVVAFPLMMLFMAVGASTGMGSASLISRYLGAGELEAANRVAGLTITLAVVLGGLITVLCLPNLDTLMHLFGATASVIPFARSYMSILIIFAVINMFAFIVAGIVRAEGNPILASSAMIVAALINIILDPILIFGIGPIPAMGVAGAAIATVIGRGVAAVILLGYFISGRSSYHLRPNHFLFRLRILKEIYRVGVASMVRMSAGSVIIALANRTAAVFGVIPLAIMGILIRASSFAFMPTVGLGQGMVPLVGYNFGAKKKERVGEFVTKAGLIGLIWGMMCFLTALLFSRQIIAIFSSDPELIAAGAEALRIFSRSLFTVGLQIILSFFFQGVGKGLPALVLSSSRQIIFLLPALLVLPRIFGPAGLWAAFPVADILAVTITIVWTVILFRQLEIPFRLRYEQPSPVRKSSSA